MRNKPFSYTHYEASDPPGKRAAANLFWCLGFEIEPHPWEAYKKGDILVWTKDWPRAKQWVEVEHKLVWTRDYEWQGWETLDVPTRKSRSGSMWFVMFNRNFNTAAVTTMGAVRVSPIVTKDTWKAGQPLTKDETFYAVPLDRLMFYKLPEGKRRWTYA